MLKKTPSPRRLLTHAGVILAVSTGLAAVYSCSLIVDTRSQQCQMDSDCTGFSGYGKCDTTSGLCVSTGTTSGTGTGGSTGSSSSSSSSSTSGNSHPCDEDGGIEGGGCYNGGVGSCPVASSNNQILNQCTTGQCFPFDDSSVHGLMANGMLPPLPRPPDGGL
jgi:hypothetical protein